jgi:hypothetical protein
MLHVVVNLLHATVSKGRVFLDGILANNSSEKWVLGTKRNVARRLAEVPKTDISADGKKSALYTP